MQDRERGPTPPSKRRERKGGGNRYGRGEGGKRVEGVGAQKLKPFKTSGGQRCCPERESGGVRG